MGVATIVLTITTIIISLYVILILFYTHWFKKLQPFTAPLIIPKNSFTVIIPARNEEQNIAACIHKIFANAYPAELFEVIVVDDHSNDRTSHIVIELQHQYPSLQLISLSEHIDGQISTAYKKKAVATAIDRSRYEWIVTTDADCEVPEKWLYTMDAFIQERDIVWIAGPVKFKVKKKWLSIFQALDFLSLQGITAASVSAGVHSMCNGANLAYRKDAFFTVNGFHDIDNIASGDDMLLMGKIKKRFPDRIGYLFTKDAIVSTLPMPDWKSFISQRIRWASKSTHYKDAKILSALVLVYLANLMIMFFPLTAIIDLRMLWWWLLFFALKAFTEMRFMYHVSRFFHQRGLLKWFIAMQPIHIYYMVIAGWLGRSGTYQWKGRTVK